LGNGGASHIFNVVAGGVLLPRAGMCLNGIWNLDHGDGDGDAAENAEPQN